MINYKLSFLVIISAFSFSCMAQRNENVQIKSKIENAQLISESMSSNNDLAVVSYHVEERINMNFGGSITTYDVPSLSMIKTNNLGINNTRIITPKYAKVKLKEAVTTIVALNAEESKVTEDKLTTSVTSIQVNTAALVKNDLKILDDSKEFIIIDMMAVYERALDKGNQSVDMLKKVSDNCYFKDDLTKAAKWYSKLFEITSDLDAVYYYRYAKSLASISQNEKADEMMKQFESKNL